MNNFLNINEITLTELESILEDAHRLKKSLEPGFKGLRRDNRLEGCNLGLYFQKPSTRTRLSFETGAIQLGGKVINIRQDEIHLNEGESIEDTAKILSLFLDAIVIRLFKEEHLYEFANSAEIPVINGLTDDSHPCQVLTDIFTFQELRGNINEKTVVWFGVANNVLNSFLHASTHFNFKIIFCGPEKFKPPEKVLDLRPDGKERLFEIEPDPIKAVKSADLIVTKDQQPYTKFTVSSDGAGYSVLNFEEEMTYYGFDIGASDETKGSTDLGVEIKSSSVYLYHYFLH